MNNPRRTKGRFTGGPSAKQKTIDANNHIAIPARDKCAMCRKARGEHRRTTKRQNVFYLCGKCFDLLDKAPFAVTMTVMARVDAAVKEGAR